MKARSIGITSEDYITDKVSNVDIFEKSNEIFENVDPALIDRIYSSKEGIDLSEFDFKDVIHPNGMLRSEKVTGTVYWHDTILYPFHLPRHEGTQLWIEPRNAGTEFLLRDTERSERQTGGIDRKGRNG